MLIKFCPKCVGEPYTRDMTMANCPVCNTTLRMTSISESEIETRDELPVTYPRGNDNTGSDDTNNQNQDTEPPQKEREDVSRGMNTQTNNSGRVFANEVVGRVSQYRTQDEKSKYFRLLPVKIYQAIAYGQRIEDVLHSFNVTEDNGRTHVVNVHGRINYGATIVDNEKVKVKGNFTHDNILMAREVSVVNNGVCTPVKFQRSVKGTFIAALIALILIVGLIGFVRSGVSFTDFLNSVYSFVTTMFVIYVLLIIVYVLSLFTRIGFILRILGGKHGRSPFGKMLVIAFFLTLLLYNTFGLGSAVASLLAGALNYVGPVIMVVLGILLLVKVIKG